MTLEDAFQLINTVMQADLGRQLSDIETLIFEGAWQGKTYPQIAEEAGYSINYLTTDVGPKFWKVLSQLLGETVNKKNFKAALQRHQRRVNSAVPEMVVSAPQGLTAAPPASPAVAANPAVTAEAIATPPLPATEWGEMLDVSQFNGRATELEMLSQWLTADSRQSQPCRLVSILGIGGVGKSSLAARFVQTIATSPQAGFTHIIWRSLRNAPPLDDLLSEIVLFLSNQTDSQSDIRRLLHWFRTHRCLVVLDNGETILQPGDRAGHYAPGYEAYGELFRVIGESSHPSCLLLTSREKPAEIATMEGRDLGVRSLTLSGSSDVGIAIVDAKGLVGTATEKQALCDRYSGNPLALKIVSSSIQDLFVGEIAPFLSQDTVLFNGIRYLLEQQFERLSYLEQSVMYWLAINREWTAIAELEDDIVPPTSRAGLFEALESLSWRNLIEKRPGSYTLQPVVMEYVSDRLVERISTEFVTGKLAFGDRYALLKTTVKDYIRESQTRLLLKPVADQICQSLGQKPVSLNQHFLQLVLTLRSMSVPYVGYGIGNLINLCIHLNLDLSLFDFSALNIQQVYLRGLNLHGTNFRSARFQKTVFTETLGSVLSVDYSPKGDLIALGDNNGHVRLHNAQDGHCIAHLNGHQNWVWGMAFSPDGQQLATGSTDETIRLWDVQTGECITVLQGHEDAVYTLSWHPDGTLLASCGQDQVIKIWDVRSGTCLHTLPITNVGIAWVAVWHPTGHLLASSGDNHTLRIWNTATWECLQVLEGHDSWILEADWHPNGKLLATSSSDYQVKLWDIETAACLKTFPHDSDVWSVAISPDGKLLASGTHGQRVKLWDIETGQCLKTLTGHRNWIWAIAWSPDGQVLASGSHDQTVRLWDVQTGQCLKTLQGYSDCAWSMAWSRDGRRLLSSTTDYSVKLWDTSTATCIHTLRGHTNWVWTVTWSPDEKTLASGGVDQTIRLWDAETGQCQKVLQGHQNAVWSVAWHPHANILASGSHDQTVKLWNTDTGQCLQTLQGHTHFVSSITWSPDGQMLVSGSHDGQIIVWDFDTGECLRVLQVNHHAVYGLSWQPGQSCFAAGHFDHIVRLWNVETGTCVQELVGHHGDIFALDWSPDGQILASGGSDKTIKLWNPENGVCLHTLTGHEGWVQSLAWHPNGEVLASCGDENQIWLWNVKTQTCETILKSDRPYEGMNITGIQGLSPAQIETLKALGAIC